MKGTSVSCHHFTQAAVRPVGRSLLTVLVFCLILGLPQVADAKTKMTRDGMSQPNILAIWGDDIGWFNLSIHNHGIMGYETPNLDKIGKEGVMFTDAYAEQSCTAGRAAFLTGQHGLRSGMLKVGLPGVPFGLSHEDPTIPEVLQEYGYRTGQFGKNHLGDVNETLPTTHGFDEFFGNLYHLNAEGEPENPDYPESDWFYNTFGPRGVIHSYSKAVTANGSYDASLDHLDPNKQGKVDEATGQYIFDSGPLTRHRMKTIDGAFTKEAIRFMSEATRDNKPFFVWYAASRMHVWTYLKEKEGYEVGTEVPHIDQAEREVWLPNSATFTAKNVALEPSYFAEGVTGLGTHPDGMVEHDMYAGELLKHLDRLGVTENTIVMYTSDNGPETFTWPDGGTTPFRSEKNTNWEGAFRVPLLVRWPAVIQPGSVSNDIIALQDWFPTLVSAATASEGRVHIKQELKNGTWAKKNSPNGDPYKVHLDGFDFYDYLHCKVGHPGLCSGPKGAIAPRREFIYANDDGVIVAMRYNNWKIVFYEQRQHAFHVWEEPFVALRVPKIFNLRSDPFEKADHDATNYDIWRFDRIFLLTPAQTAVYAFLSTFNEFPPRQVPPSFSVNIDARDIAEKCGLADSPSEEGCFPLPEGDISTLPLPVPPGFH